VKFQVFNIRGIPEAFNEFVFIHVHPTVAYPKVLPPGRSDKNGKQYLSDAAVSVPVDFKTPYNIETLSRKS
jgi:hypothetical protein